MILKLVPCVFCVKIIIYCKRHYHCTHNCLILLDGTLSENLQYFDGEILYFSCIGGKCASKNQNV